MYPLKFKSIYKEMIWGGNKLETVLGRLIPSDKTGESWDISCRKNEMGIVENGKFAGQKFIDVINSGRKAFLGTHLEKEDDFPLLIKIIDANDNLSVQVHPDDEYAQNVENSVFGKTEMWYVLDAPKDSYLIIGLKDGVTKDNFKQAVDKGTVENLLGKVYVKKGDVINIPAGLIHAITKDVMILEVQQNSDITYRVFDYNRLDKNGVGRELHVQKALDTSDFSGKHLKDCIKGLEVLDGENKTTYYILNKYFAIEKYTIKNSKKDKTDGEKFLVLTSVKNSCEIKGKDYCVKLDYSQSVFLPANLGEFEIVGDCELLKSYVGQKNDFISPLKKAGFTDEEIQKRVFIN